MTSLAIEAIALYWPILTAILLGLLLQVTPREKLGLLYAVLWNLATLPCLNGIAEWAGWWSFETSSPRLGGLPLSLWIGWAALWGALACLLSKKLSLWLVVILMALIDLLVMPLLEPLLVLGRQWIFGELFLILGVLLPGLLLYRWTAESTHLGRRTTLISLGFALLALVLIPLAAHVGSWATLLDKLTSQPPINQVCAAILATLLSIPPILAVREFVLIGRGTPVPMDAPERLVTTGIYRRIRNPMQTGITLLLFLEALYFFNPWIAFSAISILVYSLGFARWSEDSDLSRRFGKDWENYRDQVPSWRIRLRS
ncbi:methyltransferase family protein [Roseibacillus persicicus]|uniref:Protein-S-isoprenylcysteine O-methyltransferase Ste14 n=1 Tax=Roseibacillus persicicus TaxID=454148 RepID=A0A918WG00_9BACT|nr:isoprenylcysteine carboxylmethyltransferase family protein [Roseibacillus persicicus]GHC43162.1 hypothetical protein GCM10007100_05290 [Roseibacillus persicicus]